MYGNKKHLNVTVTNIHVLVCTKYIHWIPIHGSGFGIKTTNNRQFFPMTFLLKAFFRMVHSNNKVVFIKNHRKTVY